MAWLYLVIAGAFEIGWPVGLKLGVGPDGYRLWPLAFAALCMIGSGIFLLLAQRSIPMGTAYAAWTGIGAVGAFLFGLILFKEPATAARFICVGLIVAGIVGLKIFSGEPSSAG